MSIGYKKPKHSGLWVKGVVHVLKNHKAAASTWRVQKLFEDWAKNNQILDPSNSRQFIRPPDEQFLDWMASRVPPIIKKHRFLNRITNYWSYGLNIMHDYADDDSADDQPIVSTVSTDPKTAEAFTYQNPNIDYGSIIRTQNEKITLLETKIGSLSTRLSEIEDELKIQARPTKSKKKLKNENNTI